VRIHLGVLVASDVILWGNPQRNGPRSLEHTADRLLAVTMIPSGSWL